MTRTGDVPAVRRALRRAAWRSTAVLGAGVAALVVFVAAATYYSADSDALRAGGGSVPGTVVGLHEDDGIDSGHAQIRYVVGGTTYTREVDLGSYVENYVTGQQVTVYYERADPAHMTMEDEDNQPGWTVWPMIVALLAGLGLFLTGAEAEVRQLRIRRVLARSTWEPDQVTLTDRRAVGRGEVYRPVFVTSDDDVPWRGSRRVRPLRSDGPGPVRLSKATWWSARRGRVMVVTADPVAGTELILAIRRRRHRRNAD